MTWYQHIFTAISAVSTARNHRMNSGDRGYGWQLTPGAETKLDHFEDILEMVCHGLAAVATGVAGAFEGLTRLSMAISVASRRMPVTGFV